MLRSIKPSIGWWLIAFSAYAVLAAATIGLTSNGRDIATVWAANAVLLAILLSRKEIGLLGVCSAGFLANLIANFFTRDTLIGPLLFGLSNVLEVAIAAILLRSKCDIRQPITAPSNVMVFAACAGLVAPSISAGLGAATAAFVFDQPFFLSLQTWYLSDSLGLLIFTPAFFSLFRGDFVRCFVSKTKNERLEAAGLNILVFLVTLYVFFVTTKPLLFLIFTPVMLVSFRIGRLGTELAVMIVAATGAIATIYDLGPISAYTNVGAEQSQLFQAFIAVLLLTCIPIVADLGERQKRAVELTQRATAQATKAAEMESLATTDSLTGLGNRRAFDYAAAELISASCAPSCLVAIDLDHFKGVNDRFGHAAGDAALIHLANVLKFALRSQDVICRFGGDEFCILLNCMTLPDARSVASRIKSAFSSLPLELENNVVLHTSFSFGVAQLMPGMNPEGWLAEADADLYRAKARRFDRASKTFCPDFCVSRAQKLDRYSETSSAPGTNLTCWELRFGQPSVIAEFSTSNESLGFIQSAFGLRLIECAIWTRGPSLSNA